MSANSNGMWKTIALVALAAFQGLCFWTLQEIKTDIRDTMRRQGETEAHLAVIRVRHFAEDALSKPPQTSKTP